MEPSGDLPRVLLLGDSISMSYTAGVRQRLGGAAQVLRAPDNCRTTRRTLENLEAWLGKGEWHIIHINCGIHDVTRLDAKGSSAAHGEPQVPLAAYCSTLERILARLARTRARLVWATTTPVGEEVAVRRNEDIDAYNRAAAEVVARHVASVDDLHALVRASESQLWSDGVHFTDEGSEILGKAVAECVREYL